MLVAKADIQPTPTHYFFLLLQRHGILRRVFSQNIDTLETIAGLPASKIVEAHGSFATAHCIDCKKSASKEYVLKSGVRKGEVVRCGEEGCDGLVKPDIVFFGEGLPERFFQSLEVSSIAPGVHS
jgi:NAD-dependent histone deacetylase SIR2